MGTIVRVIQGRKYVLAHPHEPHAVEWEGETYRPLKPCEGHYRDNQGCCHCCGLTLELGTWREYAGEDAPAPAPVVLQYTGWP